MDRRQRRTREAIFSAFISLLSQKEFSRITVGEIIEKADVGRATFYAHFETKEYLLKELCQELFCHILDAAGKGSHDHRHIFSCDAPDSVFLHLFQHLSKNDNNILLLLASRNDGLFLEYFKDSLRQMVITQLPLFASRKHEKLPESLWIEHITASFVEVLRWWIAGGMKDSPETVTEYFYLTV